MKHPGWGWSEPMRLVLLLFLWLALLAAAPFASGTDAGAQAVQRLDRAEFVLSDTAEPPGDSAAWLPATLPDRRQAEPPATRGALWYRLTFDLAAPPQELQALYVPQLRVAGQAFVNGRLVGQTEPIEHPATGRVPRLFSVPPELLHAGRNTLHLRLQWTSPRSAQLGPVQVGPQAALLPRQQARHWQAITGLQLLATVSATLGIFMLLLWSRRREEAALGWFGLTALSYTLFLGDSSLSARRSRPGCWSRSRSSGVHWSTCPSSCSHCATPAGAGPAPNGPCGDSFRSTRWPGRCPIPSLKSSSSRSLQPGSSSSPSWPGAVAPARAWRWPLRPSVGR